ncbi:MAG: insulinase family protein [Oscillospiraceae bacterium]|jgi:predicted Zn-dependent peptidase|nr:insulinase family protein [Oscillospiraceae bacterium]
MIETKTLPNGARIVHEYMPHVRSAAVGFWVGHGSRHEPAGMGGASHAIEHMVFKGTQTRSAAELAAEIDAIGGRVNAYTTKESTCFYAHALDSHLPSAIDFLSDIFFNPRFDQEDWELERGVIVEEIAMYEDQPEDLVYQNLFASVYKDLPLGGTVLGTPETLAGMTSRQMLDYKNLHYRPCDIVVSLAGHYAPSDLEAIERILGTMAPSDCPPLTPCHYTPAFCLCEKAIEQNHLCLGFPGLPRGRELHYTDSVLTSILGAGMSSRLFQTVREENGLCYSVYSYGAKHRGTGVAGVYLALGRETEKQALELTRKVVETFVKEGPTDVELTRSREQLKANTLMAIESTVQRSSALGDATLFYGNTLEPDEIIKRIDAVTREGVMELAARIYDFSKVSLSVVGKPEDESVYRGLLCPNG